MRRLRTSTLLLYARACDVPIAAALPAHPAAAAPAGCRHCQLLATLAAAAAAAAAPHCVDIASAAAAVAAPAAYAVAVVAERATHPAGAVAFCQKLQRAISPLCPPHHRESAWGSCQRCCSSRHHIASTAEASECDDRKLCLNDYKLNVDAGGLCVNDST